MTIRPAREAPADECVPFENDPLLPITAAPADPAVDATSGFRLSFAAAVRGKPGQGLIDQLGDDLGRIRDSLFADCKCAGGVTIRCSDDLGGFGARCQNCTITMSKAWCASLGIADGTVTSPTDEMSQFDPVFTPGATPFPDIVERKCALLHETYHSCQQAPPECLNEGQAYTATAVCHVKFLQKYCWNAPLQAGGQPTQQECDDVLANFWSFMTARGFMQCMCDPNLPEATQDQKCDRCVQDCKNANPDSPGLCDTMKKQYCAKKKLWIPPILTN
jgi:hypothetical protein